MEDRSLSKDEDVEPDGGTIHWQTFKFSDCHTAMDDDRQLSSDLERHLNLNSDTVGEVMMARGPEGPVVPKTEYKAQGCMFAGQSGAAQAGGFGLGVSSTYNPSSFPGLYQPSSRASPLAHPESHNVTWGQPTNPGLWRQEDSMSSLDLEMDKEPSITPFNQVRSPPSMQNYSKGGFQSGIPGDNQKKYMHEDNLRRYDGDASYDLSNQQHQRWQHNIHLQQSAPSPVTTATPVEHDAMVVEETYTFELDEFGEGPLHTLSAVTDKTTLAKSIELLQKCDVVKQCINLQNKLKQTPLFLSVLQRNIPFIGWLLDNGADPNIQGTLYTDRDEYIWRSPLHLAAMKGDEWLCIVRLLLSKSPQTNINLFSHGDKLSALHLALKQHTDINSCRQVILELINKGADISLREQASSKTPFMLALETRDLNLVQEFLNRFPADRRRAILQEQARSGDTCLHIAAGLSRINSQDKEKLLRFLVTHGANGNVTNNVKELPRDFARKEVLETWFMTKHGLDILST
ncbi:uncharacterized protein LOC123561722 isoform X2 [Mercenaria mercenaria]|uniref:uncharacterized protein LOC123561722 isoform X2 n=1 Tax=Mercenaria mercenaria TaxID=6596 RepID=UPI00234F9B16|nr:uncharacterized protein LOC123561722 isoform X2 [Mercenaria mercenaria]